jgi:hypothetical protein
MAKSSVLFRIAFILFAGHSTPTHASARLSPGTVSKPPPTVPKQKGKLQETSSTTKTSASTSRTTLGVTVETTKTGSLAPPPPSSTTKEVGIWPCMDALDKKLLMISIPMIINFSISPLVGVNDLFWTNRMGNALAVAGMSAANQVYQTGFWLASFLPSVTSTIVSKEHAKQNPDGVQNAVCQALFVATLIALCGTGLYLLYPEKALQSVLELDAPALEYARPYLAIRALAFLPGLISLVGFSAFRGTYISYRMNGTVGIRKYTLIVYQI